MWKIIFIFLILYVVFNPFGRAIVKNLPSVVYYLPRDIYDYFYHKRYNECKCFGHINIFTGYFGNGKSLSAVEVVRHIYNHYNGLVIFDDETQEFCIQHIRVITNLQLDIPSELFTHEQQLIDIKAERGDVLVYLIDEIGTVFNCRDFKNFNPDIFNSIVQSRKRKMAIYGTLPVFSGTDVNIRRYTDKVCFCSKTWRFIRHDYFDASQLEYCSNPTLLMPLVTNYLFCPDKLFSSYDTYAFIEQLRKEKLNDGSMLNFDDLNVSNNDNYELAEKLNRRLEKKKTFFQRQKQRRKKQR